MRTGERTFNIEGLIRQLGPKHRNKDSKCCREATESSDKNIIKNEMRMTAVVS
jgi:hypothetical protein